MSNDWRRELFGSTKSLCIPAFRRLRSMLLVFGTIRELSRLSRPIAGDAVIVLKGWIILFLIASTLSLGGAAANTVPKTARAGQIFYDCSDCPVMVVIPAGKFLMGSSMEETQRDIAAMPSDESEADKRSFSSEHPQHVVAIDQPFALGRYLVTRREFASFVRETGYAASRGCTLYVNHRYPSRPGADWQNPGFAQTDDDPVVCITWNDAQAYVAWLNSKVERQTGGAHGEPYHLPSEAEWEYAARAGTTTARWWGDAIGKDNADCEGCGSPWDDLRPSPVGSFAPNPFELFDMLGSAWEWTEDCWHEDYIGAPTDGVAWTTGDSCGQYHALRGGAFFNRAWVLRSAKRIYWKTDESGDFIGFRVAKKLQ